jgi:phage baseplate assembly protein W
MTWSLQLKGGDIVKGRGNALATLTGSEKVQQDLTHWILTNLGSDPFNPGYGSVIDYDSDTIVSAQVEGEVIYVPESKLDLVVGEVDRVVGRYQARQLSRIEQESVLYNGRHTFSAGEIITDYDIEYEQVLDTLYVDINLSLLSNEERAIELTVKNRTV